MDWKPVEKFQIVSLSPKLFVVKIKDCYDETTKKLLFEDKSLKFFGFYSDKKRLIGYSLELKAKAKHENFTQSLFVSKSVLPAPRKMKILHKDSSLTFLSFGTKRTELDYFLALRTHKKASDGETS